MISYKSNIAKGNLLAIAAVLCQSVSPWPVQAADNMVRVAGQDVFSVTSPAAGMSAEQRADVIQHNLDNALVASKDRSPAGLTIVYAKGMPVVTLGGYQIVAVDAESARNSGITPALLAQSWLDSLSHALADRNSVDSYVAQLTGNVAGGLSGPQVPQQPGIGRQESRQGAYPADYSTYGGQYQPPAEVPPYRGHVVYLPQGLTIQAVLRTSISTQAAKAGDLIEAQINQPLTLGEGTIAPGATLIGTIVEADPGKRLGRSADLKIRFNRLRTADGAETPITAHIAGSIGKYKQVGSDQSGDVKGEGWGNKVGQLALRGAIGAGSGAALGTAIGAIAGHSGYAVGRGAWSGAAIGGGLGAADSLILRKGKDVTIPSGQLLQVQLDAPAQVSCTGVPPYTGTF